MKWIILFSLLLSSSAFAISHKEFVKLPRDKREKVVEAYKSFLKEYLKTVEVADSTPMTFPQFIEAAYANNYDCVYGGWPSNRVNGLCSLPRTNPAFQRESCGQGQMPCQPLLFGRGVCVPNVTRTQKRSAFANCQRNFASMGRTTADVVEYLSDPEVSQEADELFRLVDEICTTGAQATTPMCRNLKARVEAIKSARPALPAQSVPEQTPPPQLEARVEETPPQEALTVVAEEAAQVEQAVEDLNSRVQCESCAAQRAQTVDEPERREPAPIVSDSPYPRITSGYDLAACSGSRRHPDGYDIKSIGNCRTNERVDAGMSFRPGAGHPHMNVQTRYPGGSSPGRFFEMTSRNQAFNETYLMMEEYGGGPDSHNVKSYMFVIPRRTVPSARAEGNNLILTLPTGETVTMDKESKLITGGALTEGPIDLNTDRFQRRPPNIHYNGTGISIRLDHRYEHPLTSSQTATVKQGNRTCTIQRTALLNSEGQLLTTSDAALVEVLNRNCRSGGAPFRIP